MNRIVIPRCPGVSFPLLIVAVVAQFALSLPAATSSGFPPVDIFRVWFAPYLGFLGVLLFPLFDDDPTMRWTMRVMYSLATTLCLAWVLSNLYSEIPHQTNVVGVLRYSLFLAVPVFLFVWVLEHTSAWIWGRCRVFARGSAAEARRLSLPFSIAASVSAGLLLIVAVILTQYYLTRPASRRETGYTSQYHMEQILEALHEHRTTYVIFPFEERGPEHALYKLHKLQNPVDASAFDGRPRKKPLDRAAWNTLRERLTNSDFDYLNQPKFIPSVDPHRVVMTTEPFGTPGWVVLGIADGRSVWQKLPKSPASAALGSWLTEDGFLVADRQVFDDWNKTHSFSHSNAPPQEQRNGAKLVRMSDAQTTIQYEYSEGRLTRCTISNARGTTVETIATDDLGQIIGITRSLVDSESLPPSLKSPSS